VAIYTPEIFIKKNNQYISDMQNWRCFANKNIIEFTRFDILDKEACAFSQQDYL